MNDYDGFFEKKNILVTGGLGFIGLNLTNRLRELGAKIVVFDSYVSSAMTKPLSKILEGVDIVNADIRDEDRVERVMREQDIVFNLAGKSGAVDSNKTPLNDLDINCRGHLTILEACIAFNPNVTIIFPSSRLVYGRPRYLPVDENHPLSPESIYAAHKLAVENYHLIYGRLYGIKTTVLRISNPYGPHQSHGAHAYGIANRLIQSAVLDKTIYIYGDGKQQRDYIYVDDLVEAFLFAASSEKARGKIYNVGGTTAVSLFDLAEMVVSLAGSSSKIEMVSWPEEYLAVETGHYQSNITLANHDLGWQPKTPICEGLVRTIKSYLCIGAGSAR